MGNKLILGTKHMQKGDKHGDKECQEVIEGVTQSRKHTGNVTAGLWN